MICPTCHRPMREIALFTSADYVCDACRRGDRGVTGYVILDGAMAASLMKHWVRQMVFRDVEAAVGSLCRMRADMFLVEVHLPREPEWGPRLKRPEDSVAWLELHWDQAAGKVVGRV